MYHSNHLNSMQQPLGIETVPRITDHQMILDALSHHTRSAIRALQIFFGIAILAGSCTLPITSLIFAPELFDQGAVIRAKVDEQLTAVTGTLARIIHDASAASVDTRLRQAVAAVQPFDRLHEYASGVHVSECPSRFASARFRDEPS